MLQSVGSQRVRHDLAAEQQQSLSCRLTQASVCVAGGGETRQGLSLGSRQHSRRTGVNECQQPAARGWGELGEESLCGGCGGVDSSHDRCCALGRGHGSFHLLSR